MEILMLLWALGSSWYAIDTKIELEDLKNQPPRLERVIEIQVVEVPIDAECPIPKNIQVPHLTVNDLTEEDKKNYGKVADAYVVSLNSCMNYAEQQKVILDSYRKENDEK